MNLERVLWAFLSMMVPVAADATKPASMSYRQTGCYGSCVAYEVTLFADGRVIFISNVDGTPEEITTDDDVSDAVASGRHEYRVSATTARLLTDRFRAAKLFDLKDRYSNGTVDAPEYEIGFTDGGTSKKIWDNFGEKVGMPALVTELMKAVVVASGASKMAYGENGMIDQLASERFDFRSVEAGKTLVKAISRKAGAATIRGLIDRGAPFQAKWNGKSIAYWAINASITFNDVTTLQLLSQRDQIARLSSTERRQVAANFRSCKLAEIKRFAALGIDPLAGDKIKQSSSLLAAVSCIAADDDSVASLFRYYLAQGANTELVDSEGQTALFDVYEAEEVDVLADHGANMNHLNEDGQSAVFGAWSEDAVIRKMERGTKPVGKYYKSTFWEYAEARKWPKVLAWLDAHPEMKAIAQSQ